MNRPPKNDSVKSNPAAENTAAPSPLPKNEHSVGRSGEKGSPKPIPSTQGYAGKRIK
ncbi:MAG: hypothetical protein KGJ07_00290 [Patescibacteria group bacterium]|nr:hypothetical protein [Patescibacteria group bacterium]